MYEKDGKLFRSCRLDGCVLLMLSGELDIVSAPRFHAECRRLLAGRPESIVLDLVRLAYMDSRGLEEVLRLHREASGQGASLTVHLRAGSIIQRVIRLIGADAVLALETEPDETVHSL